MENARRLRSDLNDAAFLDEALGALVERHRAAEIDAGYAVYIEHSLDEADEWATWRRFARRQHRRERSAGQGGGVVV